MNTKLLSNHELEVTLKNKVAMERQITVEVISLLEEVNQRRLYLQRGYGSLIEYCIRELGYSESSAYRRISAMRVARELPRVKEAIADGRLNLVTVAKAQTVFQKEARTHKPLNVQAKEKILERLEYQSSRKAEKILLENSPHALPQEKVRELTPEYTQVSIVMSEKLIQKLNELKNFLSHKNPSPTYAELIEMLADKVLIKLKPNEIRAHTKTQRATSAREKRYIPMQLKQRVWQKSQGQCEFKDPISHRRCESKFQLQIEHKIPFAKGGDSTENNLEILCAAHNRLRAINQFGLRHMQKFIN